MKEQKNEKKRILYYYIIVLLVILLLNALVFPKLMDGNVKQVDYSSFLTDLEAGKITKVEIQETQILYTAPNNSGAPTTYSTASVNDPDLVNRLHAQGVQFSKYESELNSPIVTFFLSFLIPIAIFYVIGQFATKKLQKRLCGNSMSFGKSNAKIYVSAQTGIVFNDVAGEDEAKEALKEIVDFLHNPSKYVQIGAIMPKGALLVGPPGTGKTLLAKAVAGEAHVPFFSISGAEFVQMFVGMGAAKVRDLFKQAKEKAPCIVFIDEIDTIGKKRDAGGITGNDEREQTLNQLLTEMDGFDAKKGVVILAATNRPESLDRALLRPGRFDRRIPVELPDLAGREAILRVHANRVKMDDDINYNSIARATSGASGADLANIVNEAALGAVKKGKNQVTQRDLEEAVEIVVAGYERKGAVISPREKEIIAYHEIGHALVAALQKDSAPVHKITIIPRTSGALGYTMQIDEEERLLLTKDQAINKLATYTGGRAAEEIVFGKYTSGASNDIEQATKLARSMVTRLGMSKKFDMMALETVNNKYLGGDASLACSPETSSKVDQEVLALIREAHEKAASILNDNINKMHQLARYLLEKETITGEEFMSILKDVS
jgi:cell division protease FtsH